MKRGFSVVLRRAALGAALACIPGAAFADPALDTARAVLQKAPVIDGHNDTPWQLREIYGNDFSKFSLKTLPPEALAKTHTDIRTMREGMLGGQIWSVWVPAALPRDEAVRTVIEQIDTVERMAATYPETLQMVRTVAELEAARKAGKIASLIGMEGGAPVGNSLAVLRQFYRAGVRSMTITHSLTTEWADSATDAPKHDGLSPFGLDVIREMNRLGMIVDLSHVAETTMHDALDVARAPVLFTHSSARALVAHPRNVPDSVLKRLAANGGVVMVTFVPVFTSTARFEWGAARSAEEARQKALFPGDPKAAAAAMQAWLSANPKPRATLKDIADHIDHVRKVAGIDHVGIGGDFGGIDELPDGLETVATYPALFAELVRRGYSRDDLVKISQGNILRLMRAVEAARR